MFLENPNRKAKREQLFDISSSAHSDHMEIYTILVSTPIIILRKPTKITRTYVRSVMGRENRIMNIKCSNHSSHRKKYPSLRQSSRKTCFAGCFFSLFAMTLKNNKAARSQERGK